MNWTMTHPRGQKRLPGLNLQNGTWPLPMPSCFLAAFVPAHPKYPCPVMSGASLIGPLWHSGPDPPGQTRSAWQSPGPDGAAGTRSGSIQCTRERKRLQNQWTRENRAEAWTSFAGSYDEHGHNPIFLQCSAQTSANQTRQTDRGYHPKS